MTYRTSRPPGVLVARGWTDDDIQKVAGLNMLRVMRETEAVAARLRSISTKRGGRDGIDGSVSVVRTKRQVGAT